MQLETLKKLKLKTAATLTFEFKGQQRAGQPRHCHHSAEDLELQKLGKELLLQESLAGIPHSQG